MPLIFNDFPPAKYTRKMLSQRAAHRIIAIVIAALSAQIAVSFFPRIWSPEHRLSDWMVTFVSPRTPVDPDIVLVTVRDDHEHRRRLVSLLPTDRFHLARLTECLAEVQPRVLGFDMLFDWPDAVGAPALEKAIEVASKEIPIVVGLPIPDRDPSTNSADVESIESFASVTQASLGVIDLLEDGNQATVRSALGSQSVAPRETFANIVAQKSGLPISNRTPFSTNSFRIAWFHPTTKLNDQPVFFSNFASLDVLDICEEQGSDGLAGLFAGKIILIGSQAQNDRHRIPFSTLSEYKDGMTGIEIHATIIRQVLRGPNIVSANRWVELLIALLAAALGLAIHTHPKSRPWKKFALVGAGIAITAIAWTVYAGLHVLLPLSLILIAVTNGAFIEQAGNGIRLTASRVLKWVRETSGWRL